VSDADVMRLENLNVVVVEPDTVGGDGGSVKDAGGVQRDARRSASLFVYNA
jgi:hypothetical protein